MEYSLEIKKSARTGKDYKVISLKLGAWEKQVFLTDFEYNYLLEMENKNTK